MKRGNRTIELAEIEKREKRLVALMARELAGGAAKKIRWRSGFNASGKAVKGKPTAR